MDYFHRRDGELFCEDAKVRDLAATFGTPLYVYSRRTFAEHFAKLDLAFADVPHLICYSVKSNGNLGILRALASMGAGADVVSGGELYKAMLAGIPPEKIVYSGVGKTRTELELAVRSGIRSVNIENVEELRVLSDIAVANGRRQECALRVNPDVDAHTHEYLTTGRKENKFGIPLAQAGNAADIAAGLPGIVLTGLDMHIGSQILSPVPYRMALAQAAGIVADLRARGCDIRHLDIGGGLAVRYDHEKPMTADEFHDEIISLVRELGVDLILEPGRFIVGPAGILVGEVQFVKEAGEKRFVVLDAGMNDLIRPSLYGAHHRIEAVVDGVGEPVLTDVVGPVCESGDFLGKDRQMLPLHRGDLVAAFTAGAYGFAMSSNYNQRPRAAEVLVDGSTVSLVRRRETMADLVRAEVEV